MGLVTVQEFAERVLFGTTLEEKLTPPPQGITDLGVKRAWETPEAPGRPDGLVLGPSGVRAEFPGTAGIEDEGHRGRLLHFFANHELLATELMALVLLKFPEAPAEFRAGILQTLKEEQMHTKLYLRRMADCGVCFGELPVNGFFWNTVAPMPTPLDYVTRLSLTFEQANLDYSRGYAGVFEKAGDAETAAILTRIYRDEINHVHYGLKWFRKWKDDPSTSDWDAYQAGLALPLSAARAKGGFTFNIEGRREAGLDEEFIRSLRVYAQSKGRTPNIYWFNPGAEESLVAGSVETAAARQVGRDLALLPAFLARGDDVVLVPEMPSTGHLGCLLDAGIEMPECMVVAQAEELRERKLHSVRPWARTPDALGLAEAVGMPLILTDPELFSKSVAARFLGGLMAQSDCPLLGGLELVGRVTASREEVDEALGTLAPGACVIKAPFSTAGRDRLIRSHSDQLSSRERDWVVRLLAAQGTLVVEPWLERLCDFSIQYDRTSREGLRRRGIVVLENNRQGQFRSATVFGRLSDALNPELRRALYEGSPRVGHLVEFLGTVLEPALEVLLAEKQFEGPLGVDAFFYRASDGKPRLKPVVEINPRYTMGRVALELARFNRSGAETTLTIGKSASNPGGAVRLTPAHPEAKFAAFVRFG